MENSQVNNDHNVESQKSSKATEVKKKFLSIIVNNLTYYIFKYP